MRAIFLVRHGEPAFEDNRKYCLGRKNTGLSEEGVSQAKALKSFVSSIPDLTVISSPLARTEETCHLAGAEKYETAEGFIELDTGEWDGLPFDDIKELYPEEYKARGMDLVNTAPPGGESFADCFRRASAELKKTLADHPAGNICIFTHEGVMKMLNAYLTGIDISEAVRKRYPYCSAACYLYDGGKAYEGPVILPEESMETPDEAGCGRLLDEYGTPENVRRHCMAVAEKAVSICRQLNERGAGLDEASVRAGAMLHDAARTEKNHALKGAVWLNSLGYTALAAIVGDHMTLPAEEERISEKSVVFLADKYVKDTTPVPLYQRYFPEDLAEDKRQFHEIRYRQAVKIAGMTDSFPE